jgi:hypothetical protein
MIARAIAIIRPDQLDSISNSKLINQFYGISIDFNGLSQKKFLYVSEFLFRKNIKFCLTLNFSSTNSFLSEKEIESFYFDSMLYFFSINYIKINRNPLINVIVNNKNQVAIHDILSVSKKEILSQGFKDVEIAFFNSDIQNNFLESELPFYYFDLNSNINKPTEELIFNSYLNGYMTNKYFFVNALGLVDFNEKIFMKIGKIENRLKEENILLKNAFLETKEIISESENLKLENLLFQQRIDNNNEFMSLLRNSSISNAVQLTKEKEEVTKEKEKIIHWYHKEYEVLPLWYKRLGHIVKMFNGHRTFRSIFAKKRSS